jgi:hypothetical protein
MAQLHQGFTTGGMGLSTQFALPELHYDRSYSKRVWL